MHFLEVKLPDANNIRPLCVSLKVHWFYLFIHLYYYFTYLQNTIHKISRWEHFTW